MANAPMDRGTPPPAHSDIVVPAVLLLPYVSFFGLVERCHKGVGLVILKATEGPRRKKGQANNINVPTIPSARGTFPGHTRQWFRRPSWWPRCPEIVADPKKISNHLPWLTFQLRFCWPRNNVGGVAVTDITFHGFNQLVSLFAHEWHDSTDTCHAVSWTWTPSLAIPIWLGNRCQGWLKAL